MNRRPTPETDALAAEHRGAVIWPDFARRLEQERDEARSDLEFRRDLFKVQEEQLNKVREERDQYRGLLIRLYNDLFVHHKGEAVRDFKALFREENYN